MDSYVEHFAREFDLQLPPSPLSGRNIRILGSRRLVKGKVRVAINEIPNNKAPGTDGVTAEILRARGSYLVAILEPHTKW